MTLNHLHLETSGRCAVITLDRPKANALSRDLLWELGNVLAQCETDANIRVVILTGGNGKFFSGGADIPGLKDSLDEPFAADSPLAVGLEVMDRLEAFCKPVIAAINGFALGGGCELALACHLRIASDEAIFGQPEVNLGIVPGWGGCHRLPRLVGDSRATEWLLTGRMVSAQEAFEAGLVAKVVPSEELMDAAREIARILSEKPPVAVRAILRAVRQRALHPETGKSLEAEAFAQAAASLDSREGIDAFLEKRNPRFTGT